MSNDQLERTGDGQFPCASLGEALARLRRPPVATAVRFRILIPAEDAGQVAAYLNARFVYDRLDVVCGERWWARFAALPKALVPRPASRDGEPPPLYVRCRLTLFDVAREDVGEGADPKAAYSDAAKRAAVHFGVGRVLYAMRAPWLRAGDGDGELRRDRSGALVVDERTESWCREMYERWLEERGVAEFGDPLGHGDEPGALDLDSERSRPADAHERQPNPGESPATAIDRRRRAKAEGESSATRSDAA